MKPSVALFVMLPLVLLAAAFVLVAGPGAGAGGEEDGVYWDEPAASFVRRKVARTYVDELDPERAEKAFYRAMDAYLHELDEYCDFIPPAEYRRWKETTSGQYAGLGVKVEEVDEGILLAGVLPDGPAAKAGLRPGDTIVAADGKPLAGIGLSEIEATQMLKGAPGSRVLLRVLPGPRPPKGPPPGPPREVQVERAVIRPPTVFARRVGRQGEVGLLRLTEFAEATEEDFVAALQGLLDAGGKAVVLDLRGNGGGVLPTAVGIVNRFLARGVVVRMEGRAPGSTRTYEASPDKLLTDALPLVVLVNGESASASEVVAGALQDHRRALLLGERTYGKFLVQQITEIPDEEMAVQLTTSRYYLPSGRSYQRAAGRRANGSGEGDAQGEPAGILPDVVIPLSEEEADRLAQQFANEEARPWGEETPYPDVPAEAVDPQLAKALELLDGQLALRRIRGPQPVKPQ